MGILMTGIDYKDAGLDIRSKFSMVGKKLNEAYSFIGEIKGVLGSVILSTCNRTEIWLSTEDNSETAFEYLLCDILLLNKDEYAKYINSRKGDEAINHLFRLVCGLESQIIGEEQILTQIKESLEYSRSIEMTDHVLEVLFRSSTTAGKRVRTEISSDISDISVAEEAMKKLGKAGFSPYEKKCLVIGNGAMGKLAANELIKGGAFVTMTVRHYKKGIVDIPYGVKPVLYGDRYNEMSEYDLIVSATRSPNMTIQSSEYEKIRTGHKVFFLDFAVPRDIDPDIERFSEVSLYTIDSFRTEKYSQKIQAYIKNAEKIIEEEKKSFYEWYENRSLIKRITYLKNAASKDTISRLGKKKISEEIELRVEGATQRMMNRLLYELKDKLSEDEFLNCIEVMELAFERD